MTSHARSSVSFASTDSNVSPPASPRVSRIVERSGPQARGEPQTLDHIAVQFRERFTQLREELRESQAREARHLDAAQALATRLHARSSTLEQIAAHRDVDAASIDALQTRVRELQSDAAAAESREKRTREAAAASEKSMRAAQARARELAEQVAVLRQAMAAHMSTSSSSGTGARSTITSPGPEGSPFAAWKVANGHVLAPEASPRSCLPPAHLKRLGHIPSPDRATMRAAADAHAQVGAAAPQSLAAPRDPWRRASMTLPPVAARSSNAVLLTEHPFFPAHLYHTDSAHGVHLVEGTTIPAPRESDDSIPMDTARRMVRTVQLASPDGGGDADAFEREWAKSQHGSLKRSVLSTHARVTERRNALEQLRAVLAQSGEDGEERDSDPRGADHVAAAAES